MGTENAKLFGVPGIFDNARDGLVLVRFPGRTVVLYNRAAREILGRPPEEVLGKPLHNLLPDPAVGRRAAASAREAVGAWPGHGQEPLATRTDRGGDPDDLEVNFCRVDDVGTGGPLVLLVVRRGPVAELAELARKGVKALRRVDELERKARDLALFFSEAAHEFNTPLTVVLLQSKLLHQALGPLQPRQEKALDRIDTNVHRLMLLAQDLMDLARADAGKLILKTEPLDLADAVGREVRNVRDLADQGGVTLEFEQAGPVPVVGEPLRLRQVVANLVGNAVKFTPKGGRVDVHVGSQGGKAYVRVRDTGRGMAPEDLERLFQPFVRVAAAGQPKKPGTGLGLYLSKRIVEAHGGSVEASSPGLGKGMEFRFTVPLAPQATLPAPDATPRPRRAGHRTHRPAREAAEAAREPEATSPAPPANVASRRVRP